jgi:hypothetical protein
VDVDAVEEWAREALSKARSRLGVHRHSRLGSPKEPQGCGSQRSRSEYRLCQSARLDMAIPNNIYQCS